MKKRIISIVLAIAILTAWGTTSFATVSISNNDTGTIRPTAWLFQGNPLGTITDYGLNVYGYNSIAQGRNVTLWSSPVSSAQTWYYEAFSDGSHRLVSALGSKQYALNRSRYSSSYNNCNVMLWATNLTDSALHENSSSGGATSYTMALDPNNGYQLYHGDNATNGANITWRYLPNGKHQWYPAAQ